MSGRITSPDLMICVMARAASMAGRGSASFLAPRESDSLLPNGFAIVEASKAASSDDSSFVLYEHELRRITTCDPSWTFRWDETFLLLNTMRALELFFHWLFHPWREVNNRGLERALAILSMRSYAIGRLHDFASEPFSAGFRTKLYGKHRNGSTQKAPRQQTFKFEEVRGRHHREARLCSLWIIIDICVVELKQNNKNITRKETKKKQPDPSLDLTHTLIYKNPLTQIFPW